MNTKRIKHKEGPPAFSRPRTPRVNSGENTPEGYRTPREIREELWKSEEASPSKNDQRTWYKELGGKKSKGKTKIGMSGGMRDRTADVESVW